MQMCLIIKISPDQRSWYGIFRAHSAEMSRWGLIPWRTFTVISLFVHKLKWNFLGFQSWCLPGVSSLTWHCDLNDLPVWRLRLNPLHSNTVWRTCRDRTVRSFSVRLHRFKQVTECAWADSDVGRDWTFSTVRSYRLENFNVILVLYQFRRQITEQKKPIV